MTMHEQNAPQVLSMPRYGDSDDEIRIGEFLRIIGRQWRKIAVVTVITTALAGLYVLSAQPRFAIHGSLYLGGAATTNSQSPSVPSSLTFLSDFQSVSNVETQVGLIKAQALVEKAVLQTGLNSPVKPINAHKLVYWRWRLLHHEQIDAFRPKAGDLVAHFATFSRPVRGSISYRVIIEPHDTYRIMTLGSQMSKPQEVLTGKLGKPAAANGLSLLLKPAVTAAPPATGRQFILKVTPAQAVAAHLTGGALTVAAGGTVAQPTQNANVTLHWDNPYQGQRFVNQLMKDFIASQVSWKTQSASATKTFISSQLKKVREALTSANRKLARYQSNTGVLNVPANAKAVINQLSQYQVRRTNLLLQQTVLQQLAHEIEHGHDKLDPYLVSQTSDPALGHLAENLATAQAKLQTLRVSYRGGSSQVQQQAATVRKLSDAIKSMIHNDLAAASTSLKSINQSIAKFSGRMKKMPFQSLHVISLKQMSSVYGQLYVLLMKKEQEAEVSKAATIVNTRVVSPAELPLGIAWPKAKMTVLIGILLGLFGGLAWTIIQRSLSGRLQSADEVRRLAALPVYGLIPRSARSARRNRLLSGRSQSPFVEAFRLLRGNLYQTIAGRKPRVLAITPSARDDGRAKIAFNLAKMLAADGKSVILIDANLHRGQLHKTLALRQAPGFAEWLQTGKRPPLRSVGNPRFTALPAGKFPANAAELLNRPVLAEIIEDLKREFDFVLLDCPPLPLVSDSMTLGGHADLILSVVELEHTPRLNFIVHNEMLDSLPTRRAMIIDGVDALNYGYSYNYSKGISYDPSGHEPRRGFAGRLLTRSR